MTLEASVTKTGGADKAQGSRGRQRAVQSAQRPPQGTKTHYFVDWWYLVLVTPDGTEVRISYDEDTAREKAQAFSGTKVKARVVMEKKKYPR